MRRDIATDDARRLCGSINRDLVKPLIDFNRGMRRRYPKFTLGFEEKEDLVNLMEGLGAAIDRGARVPEGWVRDKFGVPDAEPDELLLHPAEKLTGQDTSQGPVDLNDPNAAPTAAANQDLAPLFTEVASALFARNREKSTPQHRDRIDVFVAKLCEQSDEAMAAMLRPIVAAARGAKDYEDLKRRTAEAVAKMDVNKFTDLLARAGFSVNLAGRVGIKQN